MGGQTLGGKHSDTQFDEMKNWSILFTKQAKLLYNLLANL